MCSQRATAAKRMASRRRNDRPRSGGRAPAALSCRTLSAIVDSCRPDLDIPLDFLGKRLVLDLDLLRDELVRAVLPSGFEVHGVRAPRHELAGVVLAVPGCGVLARGSRRS